MTQNQRITNEVLNRHGFPPKEMDNLPIKCCLYASTPEVPHGEMCHCEHCRFHRSQPYMDADGQMRHGYDLKAPEPVTGKFFKGCTWAFILEAIIALGIWIVWRWL